MKLRQIKLDNFRVWKDFTLPLGSRLTLLLGENGSGKTALLDGIAIGLGEILTHLPGVSGITFQKRGDIHQNRNQICPYTRVNLESRTGLIWDRLQRRDKSRKTSDAIPEGAGVKAKASP